MKNSICLLDFKFQPSGYGHYKVTYTDPTTNIAYNTTTDNMPLIDVTMDNFDDVTEQDLDTLKELCMPAEVWE